MGNLVLGGWVVFVLFLYACFATIITNNTNNSINYLLCCIITNTANSVLITFSVDC